MKKFWTQVKNYQTLIAMALGCIALVAMTWKAFGDPFVCNIIERENRPVIERLDKLIEITDWQTFVQVQSTNPDSLESLGRKWRMMRAHAKP